MISYNLVISAGEIVAFVMFINILIRPVRQIADRFNQIQRGIVGAKRVFKLIDTNEYFNDFGKENLHTIKGEIIFENVGFSYVKNKDILNNISFKVKKGETLAIVGTTGSGKSTIINLLNRFYENQKGKILIDNIPLKEYKIQHLRKQISVVLQDVFLFNKSIFENITFGDINLSLEKVKKEAKNIGAHEFIMNLPDKYYHKITERGNSLSYGQKQLISFLRAYLLNPAILILDEATSSLDSQTEDLIQIAIKKITKNRTSIIITHRLSTIQNADKIIVLNSGKIIEQGSHEELLKNKSMYYNFYNTQFSSNILNNY